jgi:hypothetical protein
MKTFDQKDICQERHWPRKTFSQKTFAQKDIFSSQMSFWQINPGQMSFWANVFLGKCLSGQMSFGQISSGQKCRSEQMSLGKCRMGKCRITVSNIMQIVYWVISLVPTTIWNTHCHEFT